VQRRFRLDVSAGTSPLDVVCRIILVDSSAWVEFDRRTYSRIDRRLTELISTTDEVATTEPVIMEVAAGARDAARELDLRRLLGRFPLLRFDAPTDFDAAVRIHRTCRSRGVTPRGLIDCMIASVALRNRASLLCHDRDLAQVADIMGLELDSASR
jgi:predicted nucleic acid-binding protein